MLSKKSELNYLETTPKRNYGHELRDDGMINVLVPRFTDRILGKYLQPKLKNLDEFGTATWFLMDGSNRVDTIADRLTEQFGEKIQPVHQRLTFFLTHLHKSLSVHFLTRLSRLEKKLYEMK